ncbi:RNA-directed DNA polymerase-like protein [Gossypium australe]|uniref:RNA-directed DNA polymerase-like protein n=1 Tax=Gossypium australe TaxID=47621 RepID=A0A5B6UUM9_9ROSI|nr:RNA-directed DNA polymerase-like protein [Gossypium australe]
MPFVLKNARATYHRLIGCGLEVYVDDMLVKSTIMEKHVQNLLKAFVVLKAYNMKLNRKSMLLVLEFHDLREDNRSEPEENPCYLRNASSVNN